MMDGENSPVVEDGLKVILDDAGGMNFEELMATGEIIDAVKSHAEAVASGDSLAEMEAAKVLLSLLKRLQKPTRTIVLQNRDRGSPAMIAQMSQIASGPDYYRVAPTREFASGTPIVFGNDDAMPSHIALGRQDKAVAADGRRFAVQYAVVEASDILTSNKADGTAIDTYASGVPGKLRAIAGNGRLAGLVASFDRDTAADYVREMSEDDMHGVKAADIAGFARPVLVRIMNQEDVTENIGDISNQRGTSDLSPVEQAQNDAKRIDLRELDINDDGTPSEAAAMAFIAAMPESERNNLIDGKRPSQKAFDRLMASVFWKAYSDAELVRLYAQSVDSEVKTILGGMASASADLAKLDGAGDLDIRSVVTEAASLAVNAKRQGVKLTTFAKQVDMTLSPDTMACVAMFADNIRSARKIGERLRAAARFAYEEFTKEDSDMFGAVQKASRDQVLDKLNEPVADAGISLFDAVDPMRVLELTASLLAKSDALSQNGDTDPLAAVLLTGEIMEIIRELGEDTAPPAAQDVPATPVATIAEARDALSRLTPFISSGQKSALRANMSGEEGQYFIDMIVALDKHIAAMPVTYGQDGMGNSANVFLHYFRAGSDWYITEKDMSGKGTEQAFGYAILNGDTDMAEIGYISIDELVGAGVELDLHWDVKTLGAVKGLDIPPAIEPDVVVDTNPFSPDVYATLTSADESRLQDTLDAYFQGRLIAVRNALRDIGWDGEQGGALSKSGITADFKFRQVGAGANIVGMSINGLEDDLTRSPTELAAAVDALLPLPAAAPGVDARSAYLAQAVAGPIDHEAWTLPKVEIEGMPQDDYDSIIAALTDANYHMEQLVMLAARTGNESQYDEAKSILRDYQAVGSLTPDLSAREIALRNSLSGLTSDGASPPLPALQVFDITTTDFEQAKVIKREAEEQEKRFGAPLSNFPKSGLMGMVGDEIRATAKYQLAYRQQSIAFKEIQRVNTWFVKTFKSEYAADREKDRNEKLAAMQAQTTTPSVSIMENYIKIAADSISALRRIDVYRVLNAVNSDNIDGVTRSDLANYIVANRPDLIAEVTAVMTEEFLDLGWSMPTIVPVTVTPTMIDAQDSAISVGVNDLLEVPPPADTSEGSQARASDLTYLNDVAVGNVDMMDDDLADKLEAVAAKYDDDEEVLAAWKKAVNAYTAHMMKAMSQ